MLFYFAKNTIKGGGVAFFSSGHRLALGHENDMRCPEKSTCFFICLI